MPDDEEEPDWEDDCVAQADTAGGSGSVGDTGRWYLWRGCHLHMGQASSKCASHPTSTVEMLAAPVLKNPNWQGKQISGAAAQLY